MRHPLILGILLLSGIGFSDRVSARDSVESCTESVNAALEKAGVNRKDIVSQNTYSEGTSGRTPSLDGWRTWFKLKNCEGSVVVYTWRTCVVADVYATGNCRVADHDR